MDLEHSFIIPVPPEQAWQALLDVEQVAPCMPGATVDAFDGEVISGKINVKVGPVQMTYAGKARFTEKDEATKTVVLEASGKETRGSGTASATIRSVTLGGVMIETPRGVSGSDFRSGYALSPSISGSRGLMGYTFQPLCLYARSTRFPYFARSEDAPTTA